MSREEAIEILKAHHMWTGEPQEIIDVRKENKALEMAISALENIGHLKDRPCSVCEFHKENGCCKWTCVFTDRLFGDMR